MRRPSRGCRTTSVGRHSRVASRPRSVTIFRPVKGHRRLGVRIRYGVERTAVRASGIVDLENAAGPEGVSLMTFGGFNCAASTGSSPWGPAARWSLAAGHGGQLGDLWQRHAPDPDLPAPCEQKRRPSLSVVADWMCASGCSTTSGGI